MLAAFINKGLTIAFLLIFWRVILEELGTEDELVELLAYFLIAQGLGDISMMYSQKLGSLLRKGIKTGSITNYIIKPYKLLIAAYATVQGSRSVNNIPALIMIIIGVVLASPSGGISILLFIVFCIIAMLISFAINVLEGVLTFYVTEPSGIMNAIAHVSRLLSGSFIPLVFFPEVLQKIAVKLPFSMMIFTPITMLEFESLNSEVISTVLLGIFWAVSMNLTIYYFWRRGLKQYEAIGL